MPWHIWSLRKWNFVSICLLLPWQTGFFDRLGADLLFTKSWIGCLHSSFNSLMSAESHKHWQAISVEAIYSASQEDKATTFYFLEHHEIGACMYLKKYLNVLLRSILSPHQFESVQTSIFPSSWLVLLGKKSPSSVVPFKYISICFAAAKCDVLRLFMKQLTKLTL